MFTLLFHSFSDPRTTQENISGCQFNRILNKVLKHSVLSIQRVHHQVQWDHSSLWRCFWSMLGSTEDFQSAARCRQLFSKAYYEVWMLLFQNKYFKTIMKISNSQLLYLVGNRGNLQKLLAAANDPTQKLDALWKKKSDLYPFQSLESQNLWSWKRPIKVIKCNPLPVTRDTYS